MARPEAADVKHHADCYFLSFNDFAEQEGIDPPEDPEWGAQAGFECCHRECPVIQPALELGRELAERYGW